MDHYSASDEPPQYQTQEASGSLSSLNKVHDDCKPIQILMLFGFKMGPALIYLIFKLCTDQHLSTFMVIALLLSIDFWATKNLFGRQLAALRWYSKTDENNIEKWCFESSQVRVPATCNITLFWVIQLTVIIFWVIITLINVITLDAFWVFLAIYCCILLTTNFIFFLQCKGQHQKKVNSLTKRFGMQFFELNEEKN